VDPESPRPPLLLPYEQLYLLLAEVEALHALLIERLGPAVPPRTEVSPTEQAVRLWKRREIQGRYGLNVGIEWPDEALREYHRFLQSR